MTATSIDSAARDALHVVGGVVPVKGYVLSVPVVVEKDPGKAGR